MRLVPCWWISVYNFFSRPKHNIINKIDVRILYSFFRLMYDGFYWPLNHPYILINCIKFIKRQSDVLFLGDCLVFGIHWLGYRRKIDMLQERIGIGSYVYKLFVFFYNPFYGYIHQKSTIKQLCWMNEWMNELMDDGNKTFHIFLIIHDQTKIYVCQTKCYWSMHSVFLSRVVG